MTPEEASLVRDGTLLYDPDKKRYGVVVFGEDEDWLGDWIQIKWSNGRIECIPISGAGHIQIVNGKTQ